MTVPARKKDGIRIAARCQASGPARRQDRPLRGREITISVDREDLEIEMLSERIRNALQASGIAYVFLGDLLGARQTAPELLYPGTGQVALVTNLPNS